MKENWEVAVSYAEKIKNSSGVLLVALFGSVARGEDKTSSDIDIAVIYQKREKFELSRELLKEKPPKVQLTLIGVNELPKETELVGALSGEGMLLYGRPIVLTEKKVALQAKLLVQYDMSSLPATEKAKVNRALYGSISRSHYGKKEYMTETKGMLAEQGMQKIAKGVLLIDRSKGPKVINMLKRFGAKVREIPLWGY